MKNYIKTYNKLWNNIWDKATEVWRSFEIFDNPLDIIRLGTSMKIHHFMWESMWVKDESSLELSTFIESLWRDLLRDNLSKIKATDSNISEKLKNNLRNKKLKIKESSRQVNYHPEVNISNLFEDFLYTLLIDKSIEKVYITLYWILPLLQNGDINPVLWVLKLLSKEKDLSIILDPIPRFNKDTFKTSLKILKRLDLNVIIPKKKVHWKAILWLSKQKWLWTYLISSGNLIRPKQEKEDITIYWKEQYSSPIVKDLKGVFDFLVWKKRTIKKSSEVMISSYWAKNKILSLCENEKKEIFISTNVFYDKEIIAALIKAANRGVKVNIVIRDKNKILLTDNLKNTTNIFLYKRCKKGHPNQQHARIYNFNSQKIAFAWSLWVDPSRMEESIEFNFPIDTDKQLKDIKNKQINNSNLI